MSRTVRAEEAETRVWAFVSEILTNPQRLAQGLEKMLEDERQPSAGEDETPWLKRIAEIDLKRERLLDLHLGGEITTEQFRAKSADLEEARLAAEGQLEAARSRLARLNDIEQSKDALISHYASHCAAGADRAILGREEPNLQDDAPPRPRPARRHPHCRLRL
jgi:hypothetical protein